MLVKELDVMFPKSIYIAGLWNSWLKLLSIFKLLTVLEKSLDKAWVQASMYTRK